MTMQAAAKGFSMACKFWTGKLLSKADNSSHDSLSARYRSCLPSTFPSSLLAAYGLHSQLLSSSWGEGFKGVWLPTQP